MGIRAPLAKLARLLSDWNRCEILGFYPDGTRDNYGQCTLRKRHAGPHIFPPQESRVRRYIRQRWSVIEISFAIGWAIYALVLLGGGALLAYTIVQFPHIL